MRRAAIVVLAALAPAAPAGAADPGRWVQTSVTPISASYQQGMASSSRNELFFAGPSYGLYRTDARLEQTAVSFDPIPADVRRREGYNHVGDLDWDATDGGRVLLPFECYTFGQPEPNTCKTGAIGVADPRTLRLRYYVKLDPASIEKAMWVAASPDGYMWTSAGGDLVAFNAADISAVNAAPGGPAISPAKRLQGAAESLAITGGVFYGNRLLVAGADRATGRFVVLSVDTATGAVQLEIERPASQEAEGIDVARAAGGVLHWVIVPRNPGATYELVNYLPAGTALRARARASRRTVTVRVTGAGVGVPGVTVRLAGKRARTNAAGRATFRRVRPGRHRGRVSRAGLETGYFAVSV